MKKNLLAIDASTEALSIALQYNGTIRTFFDVCPQQHSQKILPEINAILSECDCSLSKLDAIVFGQGPGSFTGVRISVSIAQGLAYSSSLPLVGVSTLRTMAQQAFSAGALESIAGIDARMGEIYYGHFKVDKATNVVECTDKEIVCPPEQVIKMSHSSIEHVGTAWQTYENLAKENSFNVNNDILYPDAQYMIPIAEHELHLGNAVKAEHAKPQYVRDTVTWKKLPGKK